MYNNSFRGTKHTMGRQIVFKSCGYEISEDQGGAIMTRLANQKGEYIPFAKL